MREQRGSVSLVVATVMATLVAFTMGAADLARVLNAAARAQTAADTAALAAVQEQAVPSGLAPVDVATEYAARNGAELLACACEADAFGTEVTVRVPVGPLLLFPDDRVVVARARAVVDLPE
ncbi:MAG TPA: pilus assembly protein TadG-related protein [Actinomycetota bacterium]|nr:pilus assembly protein TadG-related protein [Actinomycetota bacterium]